MPPKQDHPRRPPSLRLFYFFVIRSFPRVLRSAACCHLAFVLHLTLSLSLSTPMRAARALWRPEQHAFHA